LALATFIPPIPPSPGTEDVPEIKIHRVEFGDGYTQATRAGLNHIRRILTLNWEMLHPSDAATIINFLKAQGGDKAFYYTPSDETTPVKWTCTKFSDRRLNNGMRSVSATFEQSFNLDA